MKIKYGDTVLVTKRQYNRLLEKCSTLIAHRIEGKKCLIKIWAGKQEELDYISKVAQFNEENSIIPTFENPIQLPSY